MLGVKRAATREDAGEMMDDAREDGNDLARGVDPLDAYMAREVDPEVARRERAEAAAAAEAKRRRAMEMADAKSRGVRVGVREDWLELERAEEASVRPDEVIEIPTKKVRLLIGAGGANVKELMRQSKAMIQVLKSDEALNEGFTGSDFRATSAAARETFGVLERLIEATLAQPVPTDGGGALRASLHAIVLSSSHLSPARCAELHAATGGGASALRGELRRLWSSEHFSTSVNRSAIAFVNRVGARYVLRCAS